MVRRVRAYHYRVVMEPDEDAFHVFVPSLPGCHTFGDSEDEALTAVREAAQVHIESLWFDQQDIPSSDTEDAGGFRVEAIIPWATA